MYTRFEKILTPFCAVVYYCVRARVHPAVEEYFLVLTLQVLFYDMILQKDCARMNFLCTYMILLNFQQKNVFLQSTNNSQFT